MATAWWPWRHWTACCTRRCIDLQRSAQRQREHYVGVWLPEPLVEDTTSAASGPDTTLELAQDLSLAFLHLLERLSPAERAVFILRQAFDWAYRDIAGVVQMTETHCRQLHKRAQAKLAGEWQPPAANPSAELLLARFLQACLSGDQSNLLQLLHQDLVAYSDGGGKVIALLRPLYGPERVARFLRRLIQPRPGLQVRMARINGETGLLAWEDNTLVAAMVFCFRDQQLWRIYSIRNPDKLRHAAAQTWP